jgi:hypothetical protein
LTRFCPIAKESALWKTCVFKALLFCEGGISHD